MFGRHLYEILIIVFWLVVMGGGAYVLVRVVARAAAREARRAQARDTRRPRRR